jgi:cell division protease FtsH
MDKKARVNLWYAVFAIAVILLLQGVWSDARRIETIPYSEFEQLLRAGQIEEIFVGERHIHGTLKMPLPSGRRQFIALRIDPDFAKDLAQYGVKVTGQPESTWLRDLLS